MESAALALAQRALEYVGWFNGTYDADDTVLDGDHDLASRALAVYDAAGRDRPMPGSRSRPARPQPDFTREGDHG